MKDLLIKIWSFLETNTDQFSSLSSIVTIIGAIVGLSWINKLFIRRKISLYINSKSDALYKKIILQEKYETILKQNLKKEDWIFCSEGSKLKPEIQEKFLEAASAFSFKIRVLNQGNTTCEKVSIVVKKLIISQKKQEILNEDLSLNTLPKSCQDKNYQQGNNIIEEVDIVKKSIEDFDFAIIMENQTKIMFVNQQYNQISLEEGNHYKIIVSVREKHIGAKDWNLDFDYLNGKIVKTKASECHFWNKKLWIKNS